MQEKIYFQGNDGLKLCGIISNTDNATSAPIVILCHGFSTGKDSYTNKVLEKVFNEKGFATLRFDFLGHEESEGDFAKITISKAVENIFSAIDYVKALGYSKIGLVGSSFGGIASIMAASKSNDLFVLGLKCSAVDYYQEELRYKGENEMRHWKENGVIDYVNGSGTILKLNYSFVEDFENNNAFEAGAKIKIPTIMVQGDQDEFILVEEARKISKIIPDCVLEILPGADHKFSRQEDFNKMIKLISNFVVKKSKSK